MLGEIGRGATCPVKMFQQRPKPLGDIFQRFPRQPASPHVHVDIEIADGQACKIGVRMLDEPGTKISSFPQQGVDRSPWRARVPPAAMSDTGRTPLDKEVRQERPQVRVASASTRASAARGFLIWECLSNNELERGHDVCEIVEPQSADNSLRLPA